MIERIKARWRVWYADRLYGTLAVGLFITAGYGAVWAWPWLVTMVAPWVMLYGAGWVVIASVALFWRWRGWSRPRWLGPSYEQRKAAREHAAA